MSGERLADQQLSNLPFSKMGEHFQGRDDDGCGHRSLHHCVILELNISGYHMEQAKKNRDTGFEPPDESTAAK
jgi:DNA replication protein DnaC